MKKEKTVSRVDSLTPEQKAMMPAYIDKWIDIGLRTGETDWETFDRFMPICYEKAGLKYPTRVIRVASPLVGGLASSLASAIWKKKCDAIDGAVGDAIDGAVSGAVGDAIDGAVGEAVGDAVSGAIGDAIDGAVGEAVGDAIGGAVGDAIDGAVGEAVGEAVDDAVGGAVGDAVDDAVSGAVRGAVRGAIGGAIGGAVSEAVGEAVSGAVRDAVGTAIEIAKKAGVSLTWHCVLGGQFWVGGWYWGVAFANFFFDICKLKLSKDIMERAEAYRKVCESVNYIWANRDFVMVCARPSRIERNAQGRLHSTTGKSIEYPDGWGLYHLNGVSFPEDLWKKVVSGTMPFQEILAIKDIDQRTQAMRFGNVWDFIKHAGGIELDKKSKMSTSGKEIYYWLYKFPAGEIFREDAYYAIYDDLVPESDKQYMSGVVASSSVEEAMAWKFSDSLNQVSPEQWLALEAGVHMN